MKTKLLFLLFLASLPSFAQYTLIPDVNFENKLITLGKDSGIADGKVLTANISSLTTLNVSSSSITDLTGIQDFLALKTLHCNSNKLNTIDISKNTALTNFDCSSNLLTSLDVSKNTTLTTLYCGINQLKSLDVSTNAALKTLNCSHNNLINIDVSINVALTQLVCNDNQLNILDVSKNTVLKDLNCAYNNIASLEFSKNILLHSVMCEYNKLTNLDITKTEALDNLSCNNNQLTNLDISQNTILYSLICSNNQLTILDFSKNTNIKTIFCDFNQLTNLDVSKKNLLEMLVCDDNQLTSLNLKNGNNTNLRYRSFINNPNLTCILVDDVDYSNTNWATAKDATASYSTSCPPPYVVISNEFEDKLIALDIDTDGKNGSVLLASIANVTTIDVSNSGISDLSGIEYFTALETLICKGNSLTTIDVSHNLALKYLDCSQNPLSALEVTKNKQLSELYCDGIETVIYKKSNAKTSGTNQLTVLDLSNNLLLTKLDCSDNLIVNLDVSKNTLLTDIDCSNNQLTYLNLNNGNNAKLVNVNFKSNASLSCIQVDDVTFSNTNWTAAKDAIATYSKTACTLGITENVFNTIAVYPNPVKGDLHIDNSILEKATVYDALGKLVKTTKFAEGSTNNSINLAGLPSGIYYVYLESQGATIVKKIIVE
ncbi:MAG TPA: T9SS type A sorting domain-containing protein [Flavobacterium sp.]